MLLVDPELVANGKPATTKAAIPYAQSLFVENCGSCHTLSAAGTSGAVGPNLDTVSLSVTAIETQVRNGGGSMPAFAGQLDDAQINAISGYVAKSSGGG
jgi:mono/diheme cytochrome c family protein